MAYPDGTVSTTDEVHPTPIYESLTMGLVALALWQLRGRLAPGAIFALYLVAAGTERLLVEFIRRNDSRGARVDAPTGSERRDDRDWRGMASATAKSPGANAPSGLKSPPSVPMAFGGETLAMRATKAYIASLGTTGLLLAFSASLLLLVGTLFAFNAWPGADIRDAVESVLVDDEDDPVRVAGPEQVALDASPAALAVASAPGGATAPSGGAGGTGFGDTGGTGGGGPGSGPGGDFVGGGGQTPTGGGTSPTTGTPALPSSPTVNTG